MMSEHERVRALYEISMAVGRGSGVQETAREALSAYRRKLGCTAGGVLRRTDGSEDDRYEPVATTPAEPSVEAGYPRAVAWLREADDPAFPARVAVDGDTHAHLLELPGFGVLVLVTAGDPIDTETVDALTPVNRRLADACLTEEVERELRARRDRLEAVVETVSEPIVRVTSRDGEPIVEEVNSAFEATFGCDREVARGSSLDTLLAAGVGEKRGGGATSAAVTSDGGGRNGDGSPLDTESVWGGTDTPGDPDTSWVDDEIPTRREVRRRTTDGERVFSLRTVPVPSPGEETEQFGLYIDITEQRRRQRTLERLYRAAEEFFDAPSREAVCRRAAGVAADVLDFSSCGVHLYDREGRALEPIATRGVDHSEIGRDQLRYTDRESVVWEAYRESEPVVIPDLSAFDGTLPNDDTPVESALVLPLGNHGVFVASASTVDAFDDSDRYFGKLLAQMLRTALDRTGREQALRSIQSATRSLVTATDAATVAEQLVAYTADTIRVPYVCVWRYEPGEQVLRPVAQTDGSEELFGRTPTFEPGESLAWEVFDDNSPRVVDEVADVEGAYNADSPIQSEILVPLGEYGVLTAGSQLVDDFSRTEFEFLQTLAASAESALQIVGKQRELNVLDEVLARILRHNVRNDLNVIRGRAKLLA
ncbi:MAG: transcriptional regulator, partial [halophilic archaeon J07HB67]